jgi:hypothetical protein
MKKEQCQQYELRGGRQYTPVSRLQPPKPSSEIPEKLSVLPLPKPMVPEAQEFKLAEPKGSSESVKKPQGNPREERENIPLVEKEHMKERRAEGKERDELKKVWMHKAHGIAPSKKKAQYDVQTSSSSWKMIC